MIVVKQNDCHESRIKPRYGMQDLHSLHGQLSGCHFLISFLKASNDVSFLKSLGKIFETLGPRNEILSVLQKKRFLHLVNQIVKTVVNCNHYSLTEIIGSR